MQEYIISLDCGKHSVKAMGRNASGNSEDIKKIKFRTKSYNLSNGFIEPEGNSFKVDYEGQAYIVGEQGIEGRESYSTNKTTLLHQICGYTAITQFLEPNTKDNKVKLVLACPVSVLKIADAKEEYKNFIKGSGPVKIKINNQKFEFEIVDITIKAEGSGLLYMKPELFKDCETALIDFGGLNMTFSLYKNGSCTSNDRFAAEHGSIKLVNYVADDLTSYFKGKKIISPEKAEDILEKGYMTNMGEIDKDSIATINESKKRFLQESMRIIEKRDFNLTNVNKLAFVGGTTLKIENAIKEVYPNANIENEWTTVEGMYRIAVAKYIKSKEKKCSQAKSS